MDTTWSLWREITPTCWARLMPLLLLQDHYEFRYDFANSTKQSARRIFTVVLSHTRSIFFFNNAEEDIRFCIDSCSAVNLYQRDQCARCGKQADDHLYFVWEDLKTERYWKGPMDPLLQSDIINATRRSKAKLV